MGIPNLTMAPNEIKTLTYDIYTGPKFNAYLRDLKMCIRDRFRTASGQGSMKNGSLSVLPFKR